MRSAILFLLAVVSGLGPFPLGAQSAAPGDSPGPPESPGLPLPLSLVLEAAYAGAGRWRPDWPREIPPDAFAAEGAVVRIDLELGDKRGIGGAPWEGRAESERPRYRLARDRRGRPTDFPLALPGGAVFVQVEARYDEGGGVVGFVLDLPAAGNSLDAGTDARPEIGAAPAESFVPLSVQFPAPYLPGRGNPPAAEPVKVQSGEEIYYVLFDEGGGWISETWFDPWGNFAAYFKTRIRWEDPAEGGWTDEGRGFRVLGLEGEGYNRDQYYESGGNLSGCSGDGGYFSALYDARGRPRYWMAERGYSLQWDEGGRLRDMRDLNPSAADPGAGDPPEVPVVPVDFRYEYDVDSRGNWIVRRETALFRRGNLLLPAYSRELVRHINYVEED
jgi:hypothetical protein